MEPFRTLQLACRLAEPKARAAAADELGRHLGAEALLVFVRDDELGAFLPAAGLRQTLPGGAGWADLMRRSREPGEHRGAVAWPDRASQRDAVALSTPGGLLLVALGGSPDFSARDQLALPLLAATLRAELVAEAARGRERAAREELRHAATLTAVLDATRAELERTLVESRGLNQQLRAADQAKDEFLAMLGHELRNPLSPILSGLELIRRQEALPPGTARQLDAMERQARHLTRLVDDLLDVSRISRGVIELRRSTFPLRSALLAAVESVRPLLDQEGHRLSLGLHEPPLYVQADPVRLTQVFSNLMTNAAKYTPTGGSIDVSVSQEGGSAVVRIRDSGIGIERDVLPRVFDLFVQAPRALDRSKGGLGIGLTLVKRLLVLHGGDVEAHSEGPGRGSEFVVRLPLAEAHAEESVPPAVRPQGRALRVLLVEDNVDAAEMLGEMLSLSGYSVRIAGDGEAGIDAALDFHPEVVLVDIGLPRMDGYAVAERLRPALPGARLVALSGYGGEEYRQRGKRAGFDDYLIKPVEPRELLALLAARA